MALTVTARGTGTHNSSALTFTLSPASNLAVGSLAVLVVSADNAAANGVAFTTFAVSDTKGNVWTRRVMPLYDPGAANAGVTGAQFTTDMAGGVLTTGTTITVTFDTATTAKAWVLWEVVPASQKVVSYIASGVNTGSATTTPTVTTASLTSGDVVIGGLHNEYGTAQTVTADADATNGAWSAQQTDEIGTTAAGMTVASQAKVVSGTATQTYNPTLGTSSNVILSWLQLREIPFLKVGAVDQTSFALLASMSLRFNTFDFALKNPATIPALGNTVTLGLPTWTGTVTSVKTEDLRVDYDLVTVTATNTDVAGASAAPFGLSDAPNGTTTYSFRDMAVTQTDNLDATTTTTGSCTIQRAGLWPAMTFELTSANRGYAAQSFSVTNTTVTWPLLTAPIFKIDFGDPIVTMSVWVASQFANVPDGSISGTKITDLSVTTPKLAANAVTTAKLDANAIIANVINAGGTVQIDSTGITITDGDLIFEDAFGATALSGTGFGGSWRRFITSGVYNSDFFAQPPTPGSDINNSTNILPSWTWTVVSGTHITARSVADAGAASGRALQWSITSGGAAGDDAYIEQIIPVNGSQNRAMTYLVTAYFNSPTIANGFRATIGTQFLQEDLTTTGGSGSNFETWASIDAGLNSGLDVLSGSTVRVVPGDAYFLRVRVGVARGSGSTGSSGTVSLGDVRVSSGNTDVLVTDDLDPGTYFYSNIFQSNGALTISPSVGTTTNSIVLGGSGTRLKTGATSFPGSPTTNDLFYRTDWQMWFTYDGTRWLSTTLFTQTIEGQKAVMPFAANTTVEGLFPHPTQPIWIETFYGWFFVASTSDGSKYWTASLLAAYDLSTISNTPDVWTKESVAVNAQVSSQILYYTLAKTSTPGNLDVACGFTYRIVST